MKKRIIILIMLILFSLILVLSIIFFKNKTNDIEPFAENIIENAKEENEEKQEKQEKQINNVTKIIYGESAQGRPLEAFLIKGEEGSTKTIFLDFEVHRL